MRLSFLTLTPLITASALASSSSKWSTAPKVKTGLDQLIASKYHDLANRKVMILSNPTGITPGLDLGVDVMFESGMVNLVGVMGPEHGFRGTAQNGGGEATFVDAKTGLVVYDAYNVNVLTLRSYIQGSGADTVVFDIQDVGARFYTYIWAMYDTMVAAALTNTSFIVLDRPNPIRGIDAYGPVLNESAVNSYVGRRAIAQAHGMTVGELASMFVGEGWIAESAGGKKLPSLKVVKMEGWKRDMTFEETGLPWVIPSPNMPTPDTAAIYPGTCMFEGTNISEGRGTTRPFEILGAPWANETWTTKMRTQQIPSTNYKFQCFIPTASKFVGETACGIQVYLEPSQAGTIDPVFVGLNLLWSAYHLYGGTAAGQSKGTFSWRVTGRTYDIDLLTGGPMVRESIDAGLDPVQIRELWSEGLEEFRRKRKNYLMY